MREVDQKIALQQNKKTRFESQLKTISTEKPVQSSNRVTRSVRIASGNANNSSGSSSGSGSSGGGY